MTQPLSTIAPQVSDPILDDGDHDRFAHIILEGFTIESGEYFALGTSVVESIVTGAPVKALCGKVWVPSRNPANYSVCPTCKEEAKKRGMDVPA
jgi:hypothetical protein